MSNAALNIINKALFKDLMKLEEDKYYTIKERKNERV